MPQLDTNNLTEMQAYAYRILVQVEQLQKELQIVNQQIVKLSQPAPVQPKVETPQVEEAKVKETK